MVPPKNAFAKNRSGNDVYYKGAFILHMLRYLIGYDVLKETLKEFIYMPKEMTGNQTSTKEFVSLVSENAGQNLEWFFEQYLFKASLPTLKLTKKPYKDKVYVDIWWEEEVFVMPVSYTHLTLPTIREV